MVPQAASPARLVQTQALDAPVSSLRFVNSTRADALSRMGISTVRGLIENFPRRYLDMSQVVPISKVRIGDVVTVVGTVGEVKKKQPRPRMSIIEASLIDETGVMMGTWFRQPWMAKKLHPGDRVAFSGKVEFNYGFKRMNSPFIEVIASHSDEEAAARIIPIHPLTEGISGAWMRRLVSTALEQADCVLDPLPPKLRMRHRLISRAAAWRQVHFPQDMSQAEEAHRRLAYEELIELQLFLMSRRDAMGAGIEPIAHVVDGRHVAALASVLPFELTSEQHDAVDDILSDMAASRVMNRMLLGDVGTGKTAVALYALAAAADSGYQACMMAPTTVLAEQYRAKLGPLLDELGITWAMLAGSTSAAERAEMLPSLANGSLQVLFGTHAVLEDDVVFGKLSLVIIDEQHRFGVDQRAALRAKGPGSDLLVMTATPIPRTLALTLYGDLECSYIRKRPRALPPTTTTVLASADIADAYEAIRSEVEKGHQAYIVCPLVGNKPMKGEEGEQEDDSIIEAIEEGDDVSDAKKAEAEYRFLASKVFPEFSVGLLTGRMGPAEKTAAMDAFKAGTTEILVSTTVIEVGVDVPNATVMMVEDADRFGLSQLHQLRGRVGRGTQPGSMIVVYGKAGENAKDRLAALAASNDGFELAEHDLALRHEGDILGSRQHGLPRLRFVDVLEDGALIEAAHADARELLDADPGLDDPGHGPLRIEMAHVFADADPGEGGM